MNDNYFIDSNICVYLFDKNQNKSFIAYQLVEEEPIVSTQVIAETVNVLIKKFKFSKNDAFDSAKYILSNTNLIAVSGNNLESAFEISLKYGYSFYDSIIIASALESNCKILYSEDFHHKQKIENKLQIINPFIKS